MPVTLPKPLLGEISALTIASNDLEASLKFYQQLGFRELMRYDFPFPWIQVTDDALLIMLRKTDEKYFALTYYTKDSDAIVAELESKGIDFFKKPEAGEMIRRFVMKSPDGLSISIVTLPDGFAKPTGKSMLTMEQGDYFNPDKYANPVIGMFGELAHPVKDLDASIKFWEKLGFSAISTFSAPYPWAIITDGLSVVGLHQSTHFSFPSITYFAADMKEKIEKLKSAGLENITDMGAVNIGVTTPEGQHFFLFKMGM
jgi:predicted lactoylglutathione lyase